MKFILDVSSASLPDVEHYIGEIKPPKNYSKPESIAAYVAEEKARRISEAGLDIDLARITGMAWQAPGGTVDVTLCRDEYAETVALTHLGKWFAEGHTAITYGGQHFDLPLIQRRARYLGVAFPWLNLDRYRSPHTDLLLDLSDRDPSRRRPLSFYVKRLGFTDLSKPLTGEDESQVFHSGRWDDLAASLRHDVTAVHRLAVWLGVIPKMEAEPVL